MPIMDKTQESSTKKNGGIFVNLFMNREKYTSSPALWPVVPFSLDMQKDDVPERLKTEYNIGLSKPHIAGWALSISEELRGVEITCPALVWSRKFIEDEEGCRWELTKNETIKFYEHMSPICHKFKNKCEKFKNDCDKRDKAVVEAIFNFLDGDCGTVNAFTVAVKGFHEPGTRKCTKIKKINPHGHLNDNYEQIIHVHVEKDSAGNIQYFKYYCPCLPLTELVFPVMCEGIVIALVMVGQIIENKKVLNDAINEFACNGCIIAGVEIPSIKEYDTEIIISTMKKAVADIEKLYQIQVDRERRRLMDDVLDELAKMQRQFSLYGDKETLRDNSTLVGLDEVINSKVYDFFCKNLNVIQRKFGLKKIVPYLNAIKESGVNDGGKFCNEWLSIEPIKRTSFYENVDGENGIGDLFGDATNVNGSSEKIIYNGLIPRGSDWSVFIFENAIYKDDKGEVGEMPPIVIGIQYEGGKEGKERYLRIKDSELDWVSYVLPKFAIFARNVILAIAAHKHSDTIMDNRKTFKHETGQLYRALSGFNRDIKRKGDSLKRDISRINVLDFIRQNEFYTENVMGLFTRIKMISQIYGDNPIATPETFDVGTAFLSKWVYAFNYLCRMEEKWNDVNYTDDDDARKMYTDPAFLEHAVYNVVNNAIKYAYTNTRIYVDFIKNKDIHEFIVTNYSFYLDKNDFSIFERGVRGNNVLRGANERGTDRIEGMGMGLHIAKKLVESLQGQISFDCNLVSDYNIPYIRAFLDRYADRLTFKAVWDEKVTDNERLSHSKILKVYNDLNDAGTYNEIVNLDNYRIPLQTPIDNLIEEIQRSTYEIKFIITIPIYDNKRRNDYVTKE